MFKKEKLDLHPEPKRSIQLNRPLIMAIAAVVVTVLLLALIAAFTTSDKPKEIKVGEIKAKTDKPMTTSPILKNLPGDYSDISGIKKFMPKENGQLTLLMSKFDQLQDQYNLLRQQLAKQKYTAPPPVKSVDPKTKQAMGSNLVFAGLGSNVDSMLGKGSRPRSSLSKQNENLVATPDQINLLKDESSNKIKLDAAKGKDKSAEIYDMHNIQKPMSPYQVMAGTLIPATLITGINTTLLGSIIAQVRTNIYDTVSGRYLLIPKGSKLLGKYNSRVDAGQRRILLVFNRLVRPDGSSILLGNPTGVDITGKSGIEGDVNNHWARIIGSSTISTILSVGAGIAADNSSNAADYRETSSSKGIRGGTKAITTVGDKITSQALNIKPTITLDPGHQFSIAIKKDMVLTPYKPRR